MHPRVIPAAIALLSGLAEVALGQSSTERYETVTTRHAFDYRMQSDEMDTSPDSVFRMLLTSRVWEVNAVNRPASEGASMVGAMRIDCVVTQEPSSPLLKIFLWTDTEPDHSHPSTAYREGLMVVDRVGYRLEGAELSDDVAVWFPKFAAAEGAILYWYELNDAVPLLRSLDTGKSLRFFFGTAGGGQHMIQWTNKSRAIQSELTKLVARCKKAFGR